jgi:hypothetical protein
MSVVVKVYVCETFIIYPNAKNRSISVTGSYLDYALSILPVFSFQNNNVFVSGGSSISSLPSFSLSSSLLFTTGSSVETQRKSYKMGPGFGSKKLQPTPEVSDEGSIGEEIRMFGHASPYFIHTVSVKEN